jgi:hypothetical protein
MVTGDTGAPPQEKRSMTGRTEFTARYRVPSHATHPTTSSQRGYR